MLHPSHPILAQFPSLRVLRWDEWDESAACSIFEGWLGGRMIRADSLALFISALQDITHQPMLLAA